MSSRIVLVTVGSLGDLHPFIALSQALQARGADVVLASAAEYADKVAAAGLCFRAVRPSFAAIEADLHMSRADLTREVVAHSQFLFRRVVLPYVRAAYEDVLEISADADLVVTSTLAFGARLAAERRGLPCLGIVLQPMMFLSAYDPPIVPQAEWITRLMRSWGPRPTALMLRLVKRAMGGVFRPLAELRRELGLRPSPQNPLFDGQFSRAGAIGLYSSLLGAVQPDYPAHSRVLGFAAFDSADGRAAALDPALERFLHAGAPPLVFTLGSLIVNSPGTFYTESLAAARRLGRRAVLLVGDVDPSRYAAVGADVFVCSYAPHSLLFPRAAAVVHQGGIGTLAQGLRSGRPQLIVPFFADQLDNAARAVRLGVARSLAPRRYTAARAAESIAALQGDAAGLAAARDVGARLAAEDGAARAAEDILANVKIGG